MMRRPTATFAGNPTAKTLSCGTTRETTPKAASVMTIASTNRRGELDRREEDLRERGLRAPRRAPAATASRAAGRGRRSARDLDDELVAADRDEDEDPDEGVRLREDGALVACHRVDERAVREADERVEERSGGRHGGEQRAERERVGETDEDLLEHELDEAPTATGTSWPPRAIGAMPAASATAQTPFARFVMARDETSGRARRAARSGRARG